MLIVTFAICHPSVMNVNKKKFFFKCRHFYQKMYFRILKNGLTILGLRNSSSPSTYGYESLSSTTTEGPSPSSGSEISSEHVVWCTLLGLLLALLVKKGLTILDISQKIRPVKMITIKISNNYTIQNKLHK